jgi:hypothetical protein
MLRPYKVKSIWLKRGSPHGYALESLLPVFERLPRRYTRRCRPNYTRRNPRKCIACTGLGTR